MNQIIKIFTNHISGGWLAHDIDKMLGGSEECVVLLSEALQRRGYEVIVYHTFPEKTLNYNRSNVKYKSREQAICHDDDIFITFKDPSPWLSGAKSKIKIHWSSDVEKQWDTSLVDWFVNLTPYHQSRNIFVPGYKSLVIPHGIDENSMMDNALTEMVIHKKSILYCSSPDRGLHQLLLDWGGISKHYDDFKLKIAYGFDLFDKIIGDRGKLFKDSILKLINSYDNVELLGSLSKNEMEREYWQNYYWILPLNNPDSELYCLNAIKAQFCGMTSIVNKIGALKNTVGDYISYSDFKNGNLSVIDAHCNVEILNWDKIVEKYWLPLFEN